MKIRPVGAELFHADGRTDRHDETKSLFAILRRRLILVKRKLLSAKDKKTYDMFRRKLGARCASVSSALRFKRFCFGEETFVQTCIPIEAFRFQNLIGLAVEG
jgi:hypothetical protein